MNEHQTSDKGQGAANHCENDAAMLKTVHDALMMTSGDIGKVEAFIVREGDTYFAVADNRATIFRSSSLTPTRRQAWQGLVQLLAVELQQVRESRKKALIEAILEA